MVACDTGKAKRVEMKEVDDLGEGKDKMRKQGFEKGISAWREKEGL